MVAKKKASTTRKKATKTAPEPPVAIRIAAAFEFAISPSRPTIEDLRRQDRFRGVPPKTLREWSEADEWQKRRDELFVELAKRREDRLEEKLLKARKANVYHIIAIMETAKARMQVAETKSWEGAAKVVLQATKDLEEMRRLSSDDDSRDTRAKAGIIPIRSDMHPDEIAAMSRAMHDARRERMREMAKQHERDKTPLN